MRATARAIFGVVPVAVHVCGVLLMALVLRTVVVRASNPPSPPASLLGCSTGERRCRSSSSSSMTRRTRHGGKGQGRGTGEVMEEWVGRQASDLTGMQGARSGRGRGKERERERERE